MNINNNKRILKRYLNKWNLVANYLTEYRNILKSDKLLLIQTIIKYHKKFREQIFMFLMQRIHENKIKKEKAASQKVLNLYQKMKNEPLVKIGVIGLRNKGKSFLLNKFLFCSCCFNLICS